MAVIIFSGDYNSGKTQAMIEYYKTLPSNMTAGVVSIKTLDQEGQLSGYRLLDLKTNRDYPFIGLRQAGTLPSLDVLVRDRFTFQRRTFRIAEEILEAALDNHYIQTVLIDEIGPLELEGQGFHDILIKALASGKNVCLSINRRHLDSLMRAFKIQQPILKQID